MAEKGCVLVEAELDGMRFQIAGTHLQAGDDEARAKGSARDLRRHHQARTAPSGVPQILVGDMNIDADEDGFQTLLDDHRDERLSARRSRTRTPPTARTVGTAEASGPSTSTTCC